jgi:LAO/AO transport system kinase
LEAGKNKDSLRIGISGIPGVGKSTFIEKLGSHILTLHPTTRIAILTVDPSSPIEGGSILADRLRMTSLNNHPHVFIRPSPTSGTHGGLSRRTRESMLLLESAGYGIVFVETVGVGQTEFHVASLVDIFLLLQMPSTGDEWQAIKRGILELADLIIVNKADGDLLNDAERLKKILELSYASHDKNNGPSILSCSSLLSKGFDEIWKTLNSTIANQKAQNNFLRKRRQQNLFWFEEELLAQFKTEIDSNPKILDTLAIFRINLAENDEQLFSAQAEKALISLLRKDLHP